MGVVKTLLRILAVGCQIDLVAGAAKIDFNQFADAFMVIGNQDIRHGETPLVQMKSL